MTTIDLSLMENLWGFMLALGTFTAAFFFLFVYLLQAVVWLIQRIKLHHFKAKVKTKFNMSDFNIKPCPFCGCEHIKVVKKDFLKVEQFALKCAACDMGTPYGAPTYIVSSWNNRATDTTFSTATAGDINN